MDTRLERKREPIRPPTSYKGPWQQVLEHAQHPDHKRFFQKTQEARIPIESRAAIPLLAERSANVCTHVQPALFTTTEGSRRRRRPPVDERRQTVARPRNPAGLSRGRRDVPTPVTTRTENMVT